MDGTIRSFLFIILMYSSLLVSVRSFYHSCLPHSGLIHTRRITLSTRHFTSSLENIFNTVDDSTRNPSNNHNVLISEKMNVIFVLGGPGAGKGTQCQKISNEFGLTHLSAGELLREERASGSTDGDLIESIIQDGKIVPVAITLNLLRNAMISSGSKRFLVDGFPRNWDNVQGWEENMSELCKLESVLFIDCQEEELQNRLISRGLTSGRSDDNFASAKKRFQTYRESTLPIIEHYDKQDMVARVRGDQTVENVYEDLKKTLLPLFEAEVLNETNNSLEPNCDMKEVNLKILGRAAVISYKKINSISGECKEETQVLQLQKGKWEIVRKITTGFPNAI